MLSEMPGAHVLENFLLINQSIYQGFLKRFTRAAKKDMSRHALSQLRDSIRRVQLCTYNECLILSFKQVSFEQKMHFHVCL